jgi:hypothetical protein
MKINSRKLLLFLYDRDNHIWVNYSQLDYIWQNLSETGKRSLLSLLIKKGYLINETIEGRSSFTLSLNGKRWCEETYPGLSLEKSDQWFACILANPPQSDPYFRVLKLKIAKHNFIQINPTVFLFNGQLPFALLKEIELKYINSVLVFALQTLLVGDNYLLLNENLGISDLKRTYSGISSEIKKLISKKNSFSILNHQSNIAIFSVFERIFETLEKDRGQMKFALGTFLSGGEVLAKFHQLF